MALAWQRQSDGSYMVSAHGCTLTIEQDGTAWCWRVTTPDGDHSSGFEDSPEIAQTEAERAARRLAIDLVNRMIARREANGALTSQEQALRGKAYMFLGDNVTWAAYLGDSLLGTGPTEEDAIETAVRVYEAAIGFGDGPYQHANRDELVAALELYLVEEEKE